MKLRRDEFKAMLKECILELVQEGKIFQNTGVSEQVKIIGSPSHPSQPVTSNSRLNEAIQRTVHLVSKGDPNKASIFENIIADTARTTLQKQLSHQINGSGDMMVGSVLPEERELDQAQLGAFAAKDRWAALAFGGKGKSGT